MHTINIPLRVGDILHAVLSGELGSATLRETPLAGEFAIHKLFVSTFNLDKFDEGTARKIHAIKSVRNVTKGIGLKEAKDFVEAIAADKRFHRTGEPANEQSEYQKAALYTLGVIKKDIEGGFADQALLNRIRDLMGVVGKEKAARARKEYRERGARQDSLKSDITGQY